MRTTLPEPPHHAPASRPRLRRVHHEPAAGGPDPALRPHPTPPSHPPLPGRDEPVLLVATADRLAEAHRAVSGVLRVAFEVLDGRRHPSHLAPHVDAGVLRYWQVISQQRRARRPARPARPTRVRLCLPLPEVAEVAVVCDVDGRVRALAARFERVTVPATWRCTALRLL